MFMLVNKRSYTSCVNDVEMWALEEIVNRVIESYSRPIKVK